MKDENINDQLRNSILNRKHQTINNFNFIQEQDDQIEKARAVGDMHSNGKWVWTEYKPGKFDWRNAPKGKLSEKDLDTARKFVSKDMSKEIKEALDKKSKMDWDPYVKRSSSDVLKKVSAKTAQKDLKIAIDAELERRKGGSSVENSEQYERHLSNVTKFGYALKHVPKELITPELCEIAVRKDGFALEFVPEKLKTPELCMAAVKNNGKNLEFVPEELKTPELCAAAVKNNGYAIRYVPKAQEKLKSLFVELVEIELSKYSKISGNMIINTIKHCAEMIPFYRASEKEWQDIYMESVKGGPEESKSKGVAPKGHKVELEYTK